MKQEYIVAFSAKYATYFQPADLKSILGLLDSASDDKAPILMGFCPRSCKVQIITITISVMLFVISVLMTSFALSAEADYWTLYNGFNVSNDYLLAQMHIFIVLAIISFLGGLASLIYLKKTHPKKNQNYKDILDILA